MTLYVSDLDGTLLQPDATLSDGARAALEALIARGVPFTVASARSLTSMRQILTDLPIALPVVAFNGGVVGDLATGRARQLTTLEPRIAKAVFETMRSHDQQPFVTTHDSHAEHLYVQGAANAGQMAYLEERRAAEDPRLRGVLDVAKALEEPVLSMTVIGLAGALTPLHDALVPLPGLNLHLFDDLYAPGWTWLTVQPAAATKAAGIEALKHQSGLDEGRLVVFGDQTNDLPMFRAATHGVAVANAHPRLLAVADEVIGPNTDDAVATYLAAAE